VQEIDFKEIVSLGITVSPSLGLALELCHHHLIYVDTVVSRNSASDKAALTALVSLSF
jgi:hypothetical protein